MKLLSCHDLHFQGVTTLHTFKNKNHVDLGVACLLCQNPNSERHQPPTSIATDMLREGVSFQLNLADFWVNNMGTATSISQNQHVLLIQLF
jgi:hypothetical protein